MKNITFAYLEKQTISAAIGTLYEPSGLRKVMMHFPKVGRDLEIYVFVQDGLQNNEKIVKILKKIQNHHRICQTSQILVLKFHLGIVLII